MIKRYWRFVYAILLMLWGVGHAASLEYYQPASLSFISWDYPVVVHTGIDVDYKMTGYDWYNRNLKWSIADAPLGASIEEDGTLHWTPTAEGNYTFTIQLDLGIEEQLSKTFSVTVDNARCIFIAPNGSNTIGTGTLANPYASFGESVAKKIYDLGGKCTVYHRGGVYENLYFDWFNYSEYPYLRKLQNLIIERDAAVTIRNYPSEKATLKLLYNGFRIYKSHWIYYGLEISGGTGADAAGLLVWDESVAKRMQVHDYHHSASDNPTGIMAAGRAILDQVIAWDNYDLDEPTHWNSSNFLFYADKTDNVMADAFFIDCLSLGYSATGFKVKHSGDKAILHLHKSVGVGTRRPITMAHNHGSVRYSSFYSSYQESVIALDGTDIESPAGVCNTDEGMLFEHNVVIAANPDSTTIEWAPWMLSKDSEHPVIFNDNTIETHAQGLGNLFRPREWGSMDENWTMRFENNQLYSLSPDNAVLIIQKPYEAISKLFEYGTGNTLLPSPQQYTFKVAGRTFVVKDGVLKEKRESLPVALYWLLL